MPRKHPIFGVPVLTTRELAAREGLTVEEYLSPVLEGIEDDEKVETDRLSDRKELGKLIRQEFGKGWRVWVVGELDISIDFSGSRYKVVFEGTSPKGERGVFEADVSHWHGSFYEPPDGESLIECLSNPSWDEDLW